MNLYAESSAVLSWILGEPEGIRAYRELTQAEHVLVSELTILECVRGLIRLGAAGKVKEVDLADRRSLLADVSAGWHILPIDTEVLQRAALRFPEEPVRTMDAIHLATALVARSALADLFLLSIDHRIRLNGRRLGFKLLPK
jgi:predicted nucleic acid-binding protein